MRWRFVISVAGFFDHGPDQVEEDTYEDARRAAKRVLIEKLEDVLDSVEARGFDWNVEEVEEKGRT